MQFTVLRKTSVPSEPFRQNDDSLLVREDWSEPRTDELEAKINFEFGDRYGWVFVVFIAMKYSPWLTIKICMNKIPSSIIIHQKITEDWRL